MARMDSQTPVLEQFNTLLSSSEVLFIVFYRGHWCPCKSALLNHQSPSTPSISHSTSFLPFLSLHLPQCIHLRPLIPSRSVVSLPPTYQYMLANKAQHSTTQQITNTTHQHSLPNLPHDPRPAHPLNHRLKRYSPHRNFRANTTAPRSHAPSHRIHGLRNH